MYSRPAYAFRLSGFTTLRSRRGAGSARCRVPLSVCLLALGLIVIASGRFAPIASAYAADPTVTAGAWLAEEVRGTVLVRTAGESGADWQPLEVASTLTADSEITTGSDGTALLANGIDHIRLSPNSRIVLPTDGTGLFTRIRQSLGKVFFDVGPRPDRHFEVDAPFLVVLVKGTKFTVSANFMSNSVKVDEGTVEARSAHGGQGSATLVTAGETASSMAGGDAVNVGPSDPSDSGDAGPGKGGAEPPPVAPGSKVVPQAPEGPGEDPESPGGGDGGSEGSSGGNDGGGGDNGGSGGDPDPGDGDGDSGGDGDSDGGGSGGNDPDCPGGGSGHGHDHQNAGNGNQNAGNGNQNSGNGNQNSGNNNN